MRLLALAVLAGPLMRGADVCPPGKSYLAGGAPGAVLWSSYRGEPRPGKFCIGNQVRNQAPEPAQVSWPEAGMEQVSIKTDLRVAECCFDGVDSAKAKLRYGGHTIEVTMNRAAEEGLPAHEEGYPDLIEEDARVRTVSITGTLSAGGRDVRVDLVLKCSASQFAKQFAYQYSITDRSPDPLEVKWDLLQRMRQHAVPSVQPIPNGKTYLFLSDRTPREAEGRVEVRAKSGETVGVFKLDGFAASDTGR